MSVHGEPGFPPPVVLLSGGDTTVTVRGDGKGGPNTEFCVSAGAELDQQTVLLASVDTDGRDGSTDMAGGIVDTETIPDKKEAQLALDSNDAYTLLEERDALVKTGTTGTNVNDLHVILIDDRQS